MERSTQTRNNFIGRQLTPTKYLDTEEPLTSWNKCTAVRSPYIRGKLTYKTEFKDRSVSFSESFDPDDPALIDRYPDFTTETDLDDRPAIPTQQRDENSKRKACRKKTKLSAIPDKVSRTQNSHDTTFIPPTINICHGKGGGGGLHICKYRRAAGMDRHFQFPIK